MALNSFCFILCFVPLFAVMLFLQAIRGKFDKVGRVQLLVLLIFSYFFICYSDIRFGICVALVTVIAYFAGLFMEIKPDKRSILALEGGYKLFSDTCLL